jgi:TolB-like protein
LRSLSFAFALALALAFSSTVLAAQATVAVMPFKDLSGASSSIGEAIRETVTTDLKEVSGLRVIERSNIDKILSEQNLQAKKTDLDPLSTVKVGKLLGASLIVAGAYQKASSSVRLTARFVDVETGEIRGTAKVDGAQSDFLKLQDKITSELLRSAGLEPKKVELFAKRTRPKLKSLKTIELYGDAVVETDDAKKRDILKLALNEDPGFVYAARDLDALEKRLKQYDSAYQRETDRALKELKQQIQTEKDPQKLAMAYMQVFTKLVMQRRWRTVAALSRDVAAHPPPPGQYLDVAELAQMYLVQALMTVKDYDGALHEGEKFLQKYSSSNYFASVRMQMDQAIARKREVQDGKAEAAQAIAALPPAQMGDPCKLGEVFKEHHQLLEAHAQLDACLASGRSKLPPGVILTLLIVTTTEQGDFASARRYLDRLKSTDPQLWKSMSGYEMMIPTDG